MNSSHLRPSNERAPLSTIQDAIAQIPSVEIVGEVSNNRNWSSGPKDPVILNSGFDLDLIHGLPTTSSDEERRNLVEGTLIDLVSSSPAVVTNGSSPKTKSSSQKLKSNSTQLVEIEIASTSLSYTYYPSTAIAIARQAQDDKDVHSDSDSENMHLLPSGLDSMDLEENNRESEPLLGGVGSRGILADSTAEVIVSATGMFVFVHAWLLRFNIFRGI